MSSSRALGLGDRCVWFVLLHLLSKACRRAFLFPVSFLCRRGARETHISPISRSNMFPSGTRIREVNMGLKRKLSCKAYLRKDYRCLVQTFAESTRNECGPQERKTRRKPGTQRPSCRVVVRPQLRKESVFAFPPSQPPSSRAHFLFVFALFFPAVITYSWLVSFHSVFRIRNKE